MASTSSFLTMAVLVLLLGAANKCNAARRSLADTEPVPQVPDGVPGLPKDLVDMLNTVLQKFLALPNSVVPQPGEQLLLVPILQDLVQELEAQKAVLDQLLIANSELLRPEQELLPIIRDQMIPILKELTETANGLIPFLSSSMPAPTGMTPLLADLLQELKLLTPILKDPVVAPSSVVPILRHLVPLLANQLEEVKSLTAILKEPNSKVLLPDEMMPILRDMLRDIKLLRALSNVADLLKGNF